MTNAFENYAEEATPVWRKKREASTAKRRATIKARSAQDDALAENETLLKAYRAAKKEEIAAALAGLHGREIEGLRTVLRTLTLSSAPALVGFFEKAGWIAGLSDVDRRVVLALTSHAIARLREREGYPPFDDGLEGEPPTAFDLIEKVIWQGRRH